MRRKQTVSHRRLLHVIAATVFGVEVWTRYFIAELAYRPAILIGCDINLTLLSIPIAIVATG